MTEAMRVTTEVLIAALCYGLGRAGGTHHEACAAVAGNAERMSTDARQSCERLLVAWIAYEERQGRVDPLEIESASAAVAALVGVQAT